MAFQERRKYIPVGSGADIPVGHGPEKPYLIPRVCIIFILSMMFIPAIDAFEDEAAQRAAELEQVRERIQALRAVLDRDLNRRDAARGQLRDAEQAVARQVRALREVEARIEAHTERLAGLQRDRAQRARELDAEHDALATQVRAAHVLGRQERIKLLLNQQDPSAVGRMLVYYDFLNRARIGRIEQVNDLLDAIAALERDIIEETARLEAERGAQRTLLADLERTRERRNEVLSGIERTVRSRGQQLQRLEADEESLNELLRSLTDILADVPADIGARAAFTELRGRLDWPVRGDLAARFGQQRAGGGPRWRGYLITAPAGTEVRAVAYGRVAFSGWMPHYGNLVILEHGDDYMTLYAHGQASLREAGEWVQAGDVIARVGDSGGQARPALYFEVRRGREPQNPQAWLVQR